MADERYKAALEAAVEEVESLLAEVAKKKAFANMLAQGAGLAPVYQDIEAPTASGLASIRTDQFANFTAPSPAVRAYLRLRGEKGGATTVEAIHEALRRGGYDFRGAAEDDAKNGLKVSLGKDQEVRRLSNGTYGLWDWYPNVHREKKAAKKEASVESTDTTHEPPAATGKEVA